MWICIKHICAYALASAAQYVMHHAAGGCLLHGFPVSLTWIPTRCHTTNGSLRMKSFLASKKLNQNFLWGLSLITRIALVVENKWGMTAGKQAICVSKAISAQPSSPYPYLSVCLSIRSPPLSLAVGGRVRMWKLMGELMKEMRQRGAMDTTDNGHVCFPFRSSSKTNSNSGFQLSNADCCWEGKLNGTLSYTTSRGCNATANK